MLGRRESWPWGVLGMVVLIVAVELGIARLVPKWMHVHTFDWAVTGRVVGREARGRDVLGFGDSLMKFGFVPRVIEAGTGYRTYNLAVSGGQAQSSYVLLRRALEAGARPKAIVVDFMPHLLMHGPGRNLRQWPELLGEAEMIDLIWTACNARFSTWLVLARILPSLRARDEIRAGVLARLRGEEPFPKAILDGYRRVWATTGGSQLTPPREFDFREAELRHWEDFPRGVWRCHGVNESYLRRFITLAASRGITVYWLLPPVSPEAQARRERLGVEASYHAFVRGIQAEYPNVVVIDGRHAGFGRSAFIDPTHLAAPGASVLSAGLASVLRDRADSGHGRWVRLPTFAESTAALARTHDPGRRPGRSEVGLTR